MTIPRNNTLAFLLLGLLSVLCIATAQDVPSDPAELSRDLLYHPARRIDFGAEGIAFRSPQFTFRFDPATTSWQVIREANPVARNSEITSFKSERRKTEYKFIPLITEDAALLEIHALQDGAEVVWKSPLWNRLLLASAWLERLQRDDKLLTREKIAQIYEPADPEVAAIADDGASIWLAIRFSVGESQLGMGTLVRLNDIDPLSVPVQPWGFVHSSITHLAVENGTKALWLGTLHQNENGISPTQGLVRFDPSNGKLTSYLPESSKLLGRIVTALAVQGETLWVATDEGICGVGLPAADFTCWHLVPSVRIAAPLPVSNRPGAPASAKLAAGSYEVLWASQNFLEVATPDSFDGWVENDDLVEWENRRFDRDAYELANTFGGGANLMRVLAKPGADPLGAAHVFRAPLERIGKPDAEGWQRVRARVGWIPRAALDVIPVVQKM